MSYTSIYDAADDATFQKRCTVATWVAAQAILNESPSTPNYGGRRGWATQVDVTWDNGANRIFKL